MVKLKCTKIRNNKLVTNCMKIMQFSWKIYHFSFFTIVDCSLVITIVYTKGESHYVQMERGGSLNFIQACFLCFCLGWLGLGPFLGV